MKAITPEQALSINYVDEVLEHINSEVLKRRFHSNSKEYFHINVWRWRNFVDFDDVVAKLKEVGWEAKHGPDYCGHGPFHSVRIRTDKFNPQTIQYSTDMR